MQEDKNYQSCNDYLGISSRENIRGKRAAEQFKIWGVSLDLVIDSKKIAITKKLGGGHYSSVYQGILRNNYQSAENVAIKKIYDMEISHSRGYKKVQYASGCGMHPDKEISLLCLVSEMKLLAKLKTHPNVLMLVGCITDPIIGFEFSLITEFCDGGSLDTWLQNIAANPSAYLDEIVIESGRHSEKYGYERYDGWMDMVEKSLASGEHMCCTSTLLCFCLQVARGMIHIERCGAVHRDISARNILLKRVNAEILVKIGDFGLAREYQIYKEAHKAIEVDVRSLAIEWFTHKTFTIQSDMWAFGVLIWEIFTLGQVPYEDIPFIGTLYEYISSGGRLDKPQYVHFDVFNGLMLKAWNFDPTQRPTFKQAENLLCEHLRNCSPRKLLAIESFYNETV